MDNLKKYGVKEFYIEEANNYSDLKLARVITQYKGTYKIVTDEKERLAEVSGKFRYEVENIMEFPAVGDFVMVSFEKDDERAIIHNILKRKSIFSRTAAGIPEQNQVVATNVDILFICMSLNENYNLNRLERYLAIAWDSGAIPVVVLTKGDLCEDTFPYIQEVEGVSAFSDVIVTNFNENNRDKFLPYLKKGVTTAFIGSSGVGKSTLINEILGKEVAETQEIGKGDKGRHTTTGREMFPCDFGSVIIDTPGMREIGVLNTDVSKGFSDVEDFIGKCRFSNCSHTNEPGCAIREAISEGIIDERRVESYFKLKRESSYEGLNSKQIEAKKLDNMFKEVGGMKKGRKFIKDKAKRV